MTRSLLIEGDNLAELHKLREEFAGRVRCIYIDPPYNTKHPLSYNDSRPSAEWAAFMRERLLAARDLLTEDGSLWISIDDNEVHTLRVIGDELFEHVTTIVWVKRTGRENRATFSSGHEYIVVYARNAKAFKKVRNKLPAPNLASKYKNPDNDPRGPWQAVALTVQAGHATASQTYTFTTPSGRKIDPPPGRAWAITAEKAAELMARGELWFGAKGTAQPTRKKYLAESELELTPSTVWTPEEVGTNAEARAALIKLMDGDARFDTPKPVGLIKRVLQIATDRDSIVLDFFAGSGTTAHAVAEINSDDGGTRRFVLVQSSECFTDSDAKIFDYTAARVARVATDFDVRRAALRAEAELTKAGHTPGDDPVAT